MGKRVRRRDAAKERFWRRTIAEHRRSGLSIREFCSRRLVSEPQFYAWRRELAQRDALPRKATPPTQQARARPQFVSLQLAAQPTTAAMIEVVTRGGHTLRVPSGVDPPGGPAMLSVPGQVKIFLSVQPVDMRKGFDTLAALVSEVLRADPLSGHLFVFRSRRADRVKILYWVGDGFAIWYKRLEAGTFRFPQAGEGQTSLTISVTDLAMLLDGVDLASVKRRKRYQRPARVAG